MNIGNHDEYVMQADRIEELEGERDRLRETERKLIGDTNFLGKRLAEQNDELTRLRELLNIRNKDSFVTEGHHAALAELARLREALEYIARYEYGSEHIGEYAVAIKQYARDVLKETT